MLLQSHVDPSLPHTLVSAEDFAKLVVAYLALRPSSPLPPSLLLLPQTPQDQDQDRQQVRPQQMPPSRRPLLRVPRAGYAYYIT